MKQKACQAVCMLLIGCMLLGVLPGEVSTVQAASLSTVSAGYIGI